MKTFIKSISAGAFLVAANLAFAAEPVALNGDDLDQVNAGVLITIASTSSGSATGFLPTSYSAGSQTVLGITSNSATSSAHSVFGSAATGATSGIQIAW
jgi:hypothetical protein